MTGESMPILQFIFSFLAIPTLSHSSMSLEQWMTNQKVISQTQILANISPHDAAPGTVIASPERNIKPNGEDGMNYYYHWVRDAALTMNTLQSLRTRISPAEQKYFDILMKQYAELSRTHQLTTLSSGPGTAKYNIDGTAYSKGWCNPQNDGPALRSLTLGRFANQLLQQGEQKYVESVLYRAEIPAHTVIKADLEYVAHNWRNIDCDLWEEVRGEHFFTRMVQRKALLKGAELATLLNDPKAAEFYRAQAYEIEKALRFFWNPELGLIVPTRNFVSGPIKPKTSDIDSSVILGLLHGYTDDGFFHFSDPRILITLRKQEEIFKKMYAINQGTIPGIAIGRYPEDMYAGDNFNGAHPWFLLTSAFAHISFLASEELREKSDIQQADQLWQNGLNYLKRVQHHSSNGHMHEQFHRDSGVMTSVRDLTWSYTETLEAIWAYESISSQNK